MRFKVIKSQRASPGGQALVSGQEENRQEKKSRKQWKKDIAVSTAYKIWRRKVLGLAGLGRPFTPPSCGTLPSRCTQFGGQESESAGQSVVCAEVSLLGLHVRVLTGSSLCGGLCPNHSSCTPSCEDIGQAGLGPPPMTSLYLNHLSNGPVSKCSHVLRYWGLGCLRMNPAQKRPQIRILNTCP